MLKKLLLLIVLFVFAAPFAYSQTLGTINTIAGGEPNNVPALSVSVGYPSAVARDTAGNLYVGSFYLGGEVFKIDPNGILTTVAGNGSIFFATTVNNGDGGLATNATLGYVYGIYIDASQNIYIADGLYNTIRKVTASTGIITTVAGGGTVCTAATDTIGDGCSATSATLAEPYQVIVDANLNLFIADSGNNRIREVLASSGVIQTVAGGGTGCNAQIDSVGDGCTPTQASLNLPTGVFVDGHENLFISDSADDRVREVTASTGLIQTIAGTGDGAYNGDGILATTAEVYYPAGLFVDSSGDVFFADVDNERIREIVASSGFIQTLAGGGEGCTGQTDTFGDGCPANEAFMVPYDVTVDASNNIYIADETASLAREVVASSGIIQPFAGNGKPSFSGDGGLAKNAQLFYAYGVAADASGNAYIADLDNERIRKVTASTGIIQTVAGGGTGCNAQTDTYGDGCPATQAVLSAPTSVFVDHAGNIFISDYGDSLIREVSASTGIMSLVAGGGTGCPNQTDALGDNCPATQATLSAPWGLYVDSAGDIFIADYNNSRVREVVASTGIIQSIAGTGVDGYNGDNIPANTAQIANPTGLYGDSSGNIYFSDLDNFRIREIVASTGFIQTVAGTGTPGYNGDNILATSADILEPFGLFVDIGGNIFFGDTGNFRIREVVASTGLIQTVGGNGTPGFSGDGGLATSGSIGYVYGLSGDTNGDLFLADTYTNRVREIYGIVPADTLTITTSTLPLASVGTPYSFSLQAIDGTPPYTWSLVSGALPSGFTSLSSSGIITGVPTAVGTTTFSVQVNDSANHVQTRTLSLVVTPEGVTLQSIIVEPANSTVAIKGIQPFLAIGNYSDGSSQNLSAAVTWSSATAAVATINAAGVATGVGAGTSTITATLGNINGSTGLTVTATSPYLYVGSVTSANCCLDVLNTSTNQVIKSIPVTTFDEPFGITPDQTRIYIADNVNNLLNVVDTTTNTFVTTISVGPGATAVAVSPNGQFGYVAEFGDNNVSVFSVTTNTLVATVPIGFASTGLTVSPDGAFVYVGSAIDNRVAVISTSTNTLSSTFALTPPSGQPAAGCVGAPVFNPAGTLGYFLQTCQTASPGSISVVSIPNNSQLTTILLGTTPYDDVITPDGTQVYVVNAGSNNVSVISTSSNTVSATVAVGNAPQSIAITPDGTLVYVANTKDSTLSLIQTSTNTVSSTLALTTPFGMVIASPPPASQATTLTLAPPNVIFSGQPLGTPSSQTISITNPGTPSVSLTNIGLTGPNTSDFSLNNTCPQPPGALGGGASCSLQVVFTPVATGSFTAFVTINSTNGLASSTQSVPLAGTGNALVAAFSNLTPSQSIFAGTSSVTLAGTIGSGTTFPAPGETLSVSINGASQTVTIGSNGAFTTAFSTANIPASPTPYVITYSYAGDANFGAVTDSSTTLTVNPVVSSFTLTVTDIGTGNGAVTDNLQQIDCITTAGVQSGTCSASYSAGTPVTLTATPSGNTTFAAWGGACSGTTTCAVTMNSAQSVTASFTPPPQQISLTFSPGTTVSGMATYDCPSNPNPTPTNPCTDPNAHALALSIPQVLVPFTVTVQASEVPPSVANGICPNGDTPTQDFDCRFVTFFTYQTNANGDKVVPLCYPYANGNCVHYQVFSGTPGVEPNPSNYVGPIDWEVSWNNDAFVPPAPYTGSIPQLYDDPDYAVTPTSPYGTNCATPMLVNGNPTNPPIFCQFEFNITTAYLPNKKVDAGITGRTKQFNDVAVAFPPANVGNLTITDAPLSATAVAGSPIGYTITVTNSAGGAVTGATLTDALPAGTNVNWTISPAYAGPGTCAITGAVGAQVLSCSFGTITASQTFTIGLLSPTSSIGTFTDTATTVFGTQQILSIATLAVQGITATFSNLTPSQTIQAGTASITLSGAIGNGEQFPVGETVSISIGSVTQQVTIGNAGAFSTTFPTTALAGSSTPYPITYTYAGDGTFTPATNSSTTLTVAGTPSQFTLTVTDIGTGNGAVTDNLQQIDCITAAGVQSGTCSANYTAGTPVTLTATPSGNTTFAGWGGACSGTTTCAVTMNSVQSVTASFVPPPQLINLTFNPGTTVTGMATYDCPSNPNPTPTNPCTDPNAHALALSIPQVLTAFTVTVQASELPPSMGNGICPNGDTPTQDFDCRFVTFFTYQTNANGDKVVPLCYPYANGNCVHYQVYSGTPGVEPNPGNYVGPIDWEVSWNNDTFVPPAPYAGSIPQLYDDPDYAVTPTSPYGTNCATPMLVNGNPTNPPIFCQFEFNITTAFLPNKKVDAGITGRTKQFNDVTVAFPPANVGNLTITDAPLATPVTAGSAIGYTITVTNSAGGAVTGAVLTDALPAGTNVNWTISPTYSGPGTCAITGAIGSQVLSCSFGTIAASQTFTTGLLSASSSTGTYTDTATTVVGTQQILSIATLTVQGITASFSNLTPSQTITAGVASINLAGVIGGSSSYPASGEKVAIAIGSVTQQATIGANGAFSAAFPTTALAASTTPYTITYSYTGDGIFTSATNTSTTLTVTPSTTSALVISPSSSNFGQVPLGGLALNEVTLKNTGKTSIAISKIAMSKTGVGDFDDFFVLSLCPSTLKAGASCVLGVGYVPDRDDSVGAITSTSVVITDNAAGSPQSVPLQAETINPKASLSSSFLSFGSQKVGTTSAGKTVTITSTGTSPLILNAITVTGAYSLASSTTCAAHTTLAPNHSCSITINFDPIKSGLQAGAVNISDNTLFGKHVILLSGTGK
jgi:uncharacterized repeat protein (TIGR01451 family)